MKNKQNGTRQQIMPIIISVLISLITGVISNFLIQLPISDTLIFCILSFVVVLQINQLYALDGIRKRLEGIITLSSLFIKTFSGMQEKIMKLPREKSVLTGDLIDVFLKPLSGLFQSISEAFIEFVLKSGSPEEHEDIRILIEKMNRKEISRAEADRLKVLLEKERKRCEDADDNLGAFIVDVLICSLLGSIASVFVERE